MFPNFNSKRLWALFIFIGLVVGDAFLGMVELPTTELMYAVGAYILGDSFRGSGLASILGTALSLGGPVLDKATPDIDVKPEPTVE